jgi:hypothetical protein
MFHNTTNQLQACQKRRVSDTLLNPAIKFNPSFMAEDRNDTSNIFRENT